MAIGGDLSNWFWQWHLGVAAAIVTALVVYARGWWLIRGRCLEQEPLGPRIASPISLLLYVAGASLLALTLLSPLNALALRFFFMRVIQHLLLVALIPCLLLVTNPLPVMLAGLPASFRERIIGRLEARPALQQSARHLTAPGMVWIVFASCFWLWYDPRIHQATLERAWLHGLEMISLFSAGMLYWWHITGAAPRIHEPLPPLVRIVYTAVGTWPVKLVGIIVLFSQPQVYQYPATFQLSGLLVSDQSLGGIIVWVLGGIVFSATATVQMRQWLGAEDEKPALPESLWDTDEAMAAPGFRNRNRMRH